MAIPLLFWMKFGRIDGFAVGFTAFLLMLAAAVEYLPAAVDKAEAQGLDRVPRTQPRWYDRLAVGWLLAIPFAPALSWMLRSGVDVDRANWIWVLGISALLSVVVPLVCVLPLLRYVRRGTAGISLTILSVGTGFPVATGAGSAYDVLRGPEWQSVTITHIDGLVPLVELADGRTLSYSTAIPLQVAPARLLVLRGFERVIDAEE